MGAIYLVRHGQASFGAADYDNLSELGVRQSAIIGATLRDRGERFDRVLSGTLRRQRDTAAGALAAAGWARSYATDARWNEYDHIGLAGNAGDGSASRDRQAANRQYQRKLEEAIEQWVAAGESAAYPESWVGFQARVRAAFDELAENLGRGGRALVFTSGGVIAALCAGLLGGAGQAFITLNRVAVNGAFTTLVTGRSGISMVSYNEHAHFTGNSADLLSYR
ncbi:broad specificity phosphatase PhoE [Tamaricihabitans halophyticus]|uniref:Broad specificity phosphatase PhoE n=1 Tax=Tamaricihabitans halophyticus TaxID=1262583 RepID=A0A4R2QCV3_9PSEU|nr:histidine phosphatase family protein [Tamaricihabitans halophyticus]TCP46853.1 broad specificity phosphatase PhoE [Tamaricihabitans halophyticus]